MNTITLSDYVGYIFTEIVRAREIADMHSREIAERYSKDEVLSSFSVPRFKIPEMNLTIPVLVTGAKFASTFKFTMSLVDFSAVLNAQLSTIINKLKLSKIDGTKIKDIKGINVIKFDLKNILPRSGPKKLSPASDMIKKIYDEVVLNTEKEVRDQILASRWAELLDMVLENEKLQITYNDKNPNGEAYLESLAKLIDKVDNSYIIDKVKVENLMVSPITNIVKTEGDEKSIFTINAKIVEEGLFIKTVDNNGKQTKIVDFE